MSNLINKTRLQKFAEGFWEKVKGRYDKAFKEATITEKTNTEKKITFTRISGTDPVDVSLQDYARLSDRNKFEKDVSVDDAKTVAIPISVISMDQFHQDVEQLGIED